MSDSYDTASRDSLLNVVLDKLQKSGKTVIVGRVIIVARFLRREANVDHFTEFFPKLFDKFHQDGETTGILLCYPTCCVHVLEAKTSVIMSILRDMLAAGPQEHRLAEARVVASTEDIPMRCFGAWHAAFVNTATNTDNIDAADSTTIVKSASELNASMRKLGGSLTDLTEVRGECLPWWYALHASELKRRLAAMDQYCEDLPAPELLMSLVPAEVSASSSAGNYCPFAPLPTLLINGAMHLQDAPTVEEFLDIFDAPVTVELDSEKVWPMPSMLKAWN
ncbi:hypothetical protein QJQ45_014199 [Haematococcus lacustris]|nr:hypothetical protein QJQ45_014199 [Haematococcus lacustris]